MKDIKRRSISMILAATLFFGMTYSNVYADDEIQETYEEKMAIEEIIEEKNEAELSEQVEQFEKIEKIEMLEKVEKKMPVLEESVLKEINKMPAVDELKMEMPAEELKEELKAEEKEALVEEEKIAEVQTAPVEMMDVAEKKESVEKIEKIADPMPAEMVKEAVETIPAELVKEAKKMTEAMEETVVEAIEEEAEEEIPAAPAEPEVTSVTVSSASGYVMHLENPDKTIQLTAKTMDKDKNQAANQNVTWSSANEALATVDENGLVTVLATDKCSVKITAVSEDNPNVSSSKTITVRKITLNDVTISITGSTKATTGIEQHYGIGFKPEYAAEALGLDQASFSWSLTSGIDLATISEDGLLMPLQAGKAVISLTTDLNKKISPKTVTIAEPVKVKSLTVSPMSFQLTVGSDADPTKQIKAAISPSNAANKNVIWESSDESVATVDANGLVKGIGAGKAMITATSESDPDIRKTISVTVKEFVSVESISVVNWATNKPVSTLNLTTGEYGDLMAKIVPANVSDSKIVWTCSDSSVLEMFPQGSYNALYAKQPGNAIVTAASDADGSILANVEVSVSDPSAKEYSIHVTHYFTKTFVCDDMYNGVPSPYDFMLEDKVQTVKHGDIVDANDYAFAGPIQYPYNFEYNGQKYMLSGSYVAADGVYGDAPFEAKSDIDIIYTYSAIATYTVTYNFLDVEMKAPVRDSASRSYEIMLGYVDQPYNFTKTVNANNTLDGYTFVRVEGDVEGIFNEANANKEINLYFEKIQPVVDEEPVIEEPVKEPEIEEPVIEEPVVEQPEEIEEPEVPQAEPEIEEPAHKTRKTEKEDPIEETTSEETVEIAEEIADEETPLSDFVEEESEDEEIVADDATPMAAFEMEEVEDTDIAEEPVLVKSPLTGDERHTASWAGLSLASLLGILFLERKKRMTE